MPTEYYPIFPRLTTDAEYVELLPLVIEFCRVTGEPFWKCTHAITASMFPTSDYLTHLFKVEGKIVGYWCGHFISPTEFHVLQAECSIPDVTREAFKALIGRMDALGVREISLLTIHPTKLFEKFGFKFQKSYMTLEVKDGLQ